MSERTERKRIVVDVLVDEDQYWGKVDSTIVLEHLETTLKEVALPNQGIKVHAVQIPHYDVPLIHSHDGNDGCNACFQLAEDQRPFIEDKE